MPKTLQDASERPAGQCCEHAPPTAPGSFIHHPAFRSLVLPLLLALFGIAMVRSGLGVGHATLCWRPRLPGALAWPSGFRWPAAARRRKLPWILFGALGLAALDALDALRGGGNGRPVLAWVAACLEAHHFHHTVRKLNHLTALLCRPTYPRSRPTWLQPGLPKPGRRNRLSMPRAIEILP